MLERAWRRAIGVVDAQVHDPSPARPWPYGEESRVALVCELVLAAMDVVGVQHAVIAPRHDLAFAEAGPRRHPDRLSRVVMVDHLAPDVDEAVARAMAEPGVVALRAAVVDYAGDRGAEDLRAGAYDALFSAAERHDAPLFLLAPGHPEALGPVARAHPGLRMIVDHLGLRQYPPLSMDADPWEKLAGLLSLAEFDNVYVKVCGAGLLSGEPYPHADVWPRLHEVLAAFGVERCVWASDFTRLRMVPDTEPWAGTYAESLDLYRDSDQLSAAEKELLLGGSLRRLLAWPAT
jgi:predicted TIM-barrel fold metal-dependent hydrolase